MSSIRLDSLTKRYPNGELAVDDVSLSIDDGEFLVLVGPSGCGKSTTLRMIAGLEEVTSGQIHIGNKRVTENSPGERDIAMVFQNYALYPHMTARQNMSFGLRMRKTAKAEIRQRVADAAKILSIESLLERRPSQLSGGQRQRVALGRAIVRQPAAFLLDEPLSNLDAKLRIQMRRELADLHQRLKTTTLYVTHDQAEAMTLGQRIVVMHQGRIQQVGTPFETYQRPANRFVAGFIGNPPMNLIAGELILKDQQPVFESGWIRFNMGTSHTSLAGTKPVSCFLGFRPEHLSIEPEAGSFTTVTVNLVEQFGNETLIYFRIADTDCVARAPNSISVARGQEINLGLPQSSAQLFSAEPDGRRLS